MNTNAKYIFEGDTSGMERAYKTGNKLVEELIRSVASMTPAYSNADKAADALLKRNNDLERAAGRLRASLVTPQSEYKAAIDLANQALNAQLISEADYAMAIDKATDALTKQTTVIDPLVAKAAQIKAALVTPQQEHKAAVELANQALARNLLTQDEYAAAVARANAVLTKQTTVIDPLVAKASQIKASLVTPQQQYKAAIDVANEALSKQLLTEEEHAAAILLAKDALDAKDETLQKSLQHADRIKQAAVTPEQQHAAAIARAKELLDKKLITQKQYDIELANQNRLLREAKFAQEQAFTAGQSTQESMMKSMEGMALKVFGVQAAYQALASSVTAVASQHVKLNESVQHTIDLIAHEELKLQIKSGALPSQVEEKIPQIQKALMETPVTDLAGGLQIQAQIESSGFQQADIDNNEALRSSLRIKAATNGFRQGNADVNKSTKSIAMFQKALGNQVPAAQDIERTGAQMTALFKESEIEFSDLDQLAQNTAAMAGHGLNEQEILATFSTARDQIGAEKGASGFRTFVTRTGTAGGNKERTKALAMAGLKPEDVALAKGGKQLIPTLKRIRAAMDQMSEEQQNVFLNELYGEEGATFARTALDPKNIAQIEQRIKAQADNTEFTNNISSFQGSREARNTRTKIRDQASAREIDRQRQGTTWKEYKEYQQAERQELQAEGTVGGFRTAVNGAIVDYVWNPVVENLGFAPTPIEDLENGPRIKGSANSPREQAARENRRGKQKVEAREKQRQQMLPPKPNDGFAPLPAEFAPPAQSSPLDLTFDDGDHNPFGYGRPRPNIDPTAIKELTAALKANTEATAQNTDKPAPVVVASIKRPVNQPSKPRPSQALAAPSQLS